MSHHPLASAPSLFDRGILVRATVDAFVKLDPRRLVRNPVIFVTEVVALVVTLVFVEDVATGTGTPVFDGQIAAWLWFTVLFANFAEAVAEGRGKAQADALRKTRSDTVAKRLMFTDPDDRAHSVVSSLELELATRQDRKSVV